jgi:hypothetical protein
VPEEQFCSRRSPQEQRLLEVRGAQAFVDGYLHTGREMQVVSLEQMLSRQRVAVK